MKNYFVKKPFLIRWWRVEVDRMKITMLVRFAFIDLHHKDFHQRTVQCKVSERFPLTWAFFKGELFGLWTFHCHQADGFITERLFHRTNYIITQTLFSILYLTVAFYSLCRHRSLNAVCVTNREDEFLKSLPKAFRRLSQRLCEKLGKLIAKWSDQETNISVS